MSPFACCLVALLALGKPPTQLFTRCEKLNLSVVALSSKPVTLNLLLITCDPMSQTCLYLLCCYPFAVLFPCSFPYIMKSKFGNYTTLNALAEQRRVQGGTFDLRVLTDGSPSKAKICHHLMMEKVMDRIEELEKWHLKLVVMHNFMCAIIEEQASERAHQHWARNKDSRWDIWVVESEAHDISQSIITHTLWPGWPTVCDYVKGQSLTFNVLWGVAYGVFKEILCLNSLENFNTTEADLMDLKSNIFTTWKSRDKHRTSSLGPTFTPSSVGASKKKSTLGDTFTPL